MIDYNEFLSDEEKISHLREKIEIEKSKMSKQLDQSRETDEKLDILEEYYVLLKQINDKHIECIDTSDSEDTENF